ncbi:MAG: phosphoribosylglycinamide synthetase C domain-containing protein, partial [Spirochaetota bacterium]
PVPWLPDEMLETIEKDVVIPTVQGLDADGLRYTGVLYIGLMITEGGPKVLEYNVRLGDPETQVLLPLLNSDFLDICDAMVSGRVSDAFLDIENLVSVGVVIASAGYPLDHKTGYPISIDTTDAHPVTPKNSDHFLFQGGISLSAEHQLLTSGGRCLTCVARGRNLVEARAAAYRIAEAVDFEGAWFRGDIGSRIFGE